MPNVSGTGGTYTGVGVGDPSPPVPSYPEENRIPANYTIYTDGHTVDAVPGGGTPGLDHISLSSASAVIQGAIDALTPYGVGTGKGGGRIRLTQGDYTLAEEIRIRGWTGGGSLFPLTNLLIEGDGFTSRLFQPTLGQNGVVLENAAPVSFRDLRILAGASARSALLSDNTGLDSLCGWNQGRLENVILQSSSPTYPAGYFKNFFDLDAPKLIVQNSAADALVLENDSAIGNYGNSHFGYLRCIAPFTSPFAGLKIRSVTAPKFLNLITFDNYECFSGWYGIYVEGAKFCRWGFVDLENNFHAVFLTGNAGGPYSETRHCSIENGYILPVGTNVAIQQSLYTGGNKVRAYVAGGATAVPVSDSSDFRPANEYDITVETRAAAKNNTITKPYVHSITTRYTDQPTFDVRETPASGPPNTKTTDYTLARSDVGRVIEMNAATTKTITVPQDANEELPLGTEITVRQIGAGQVSFVGDTGVLLRYMTGKTGVTAGQWAEVICRKRATNEWVLSGDIA